MLKSMIGAGGSVNSSKVGVKAAPALNTRSASQDNSLIEKKKHGARGTNNPFRFIEAALGEAKSKIEKMKNTPQILDSMPDVSIILVVYTLCY